MNHKLTALENSTCELYNPAAMCDPNKNMVGITFTMGGEDNAYLYVNFTDREAFNFMDTTVYVQCKSHEPSVCFLVTFVDQCPSEAFTMAAKVSISIVAIFIALLVIIVIGILAAFCVRRQWKNLPRKSEERKLLKYTQMDWNVYSIMFIFIFVFVYL